MSALSEKYNFDEWVSSVFDHEVTEPEWYWALRCESDWIDSSPITVVEYVTRLFEEPERLLDQYSRAQIGQGICYLSSGACSEYPWLLTYDQVPVAEQSRCIKSIGKLFARLFAPNCLPQLGHLTKKSDISDPLNSVCYMWWENFNAGSPPDARFDWCIEVMEETLKLPSEACCESALHGLGHEEDKVPETVHRIIDKFLAERSSVSPELRAYAARAREGAIQ